MPCGLFFLKKIGRKIRLGIDISDVILYNGSNMGGGPKKWVKDYGETKNIYDRQCAFGPCLGMVLARGEL